MKKVASASREASEWGERKMAGKNPAFPTPSLIDLQNYDEMFQLI